MQAHYKEALSFAEHDLILEIEMPKSAGELIKEKCSTGYEKVVDDACEIIGETATHITLLVTHLIEFCPSNDLYCRIYLWEYVNSDYSIAEKDARRDSFNYKLYYFSEDGTEEALVYQERDGMIFASPILEPLIIQVSTFSINP